MQQTTARNINDCKVIDFMFRGNRHYTVTVKENYGLQINLNSSKMEYFVRFDEIKEICFLTGCNTQIIMKSKAYLFINHSSEMITVGL